MRHKRLRPLKLKRLNNITFLLVFITSVFYTYNLNGQTLSPPKKHRKMSGLKAAEKTLPAIVHLETEGGKRPCEPLPTLPYYSFLRPFPNKKFKRLLSTHLGTGILIDPDGHILTNAFLIYGSHRIRVLLPNGRWFNAKLVGSDLKTDLSLLKIKGEKPFTHIPSGDSDKVSIGERVFALGHHIAFKPTITEGIICAKHQKGIVEPISYKDFLQTDTRIDLDNSGGPLINYQGEVIGINDALLTRYSRFQGIGFAVPWNIAIHVAHQIISHGRVEHGWLGLRVQDVILRSYQSPRGYIRGVMAVDVINNGPAQKAGIKPGDVIISYQKKPVRASSYLKRLVSTTPIGQAAILEILRNGVRRKVTAQIGARVEEVYSLSPVKKRLGITVVPFRYHNKKFKGTKGGVVISWIDPDGPMERAGFEANDIIIEANGLPIHTQNDLQHVLSKLKPGDRVIFLAIDHRTNKTGYVQVRTQ